MRGRGVDCKFESEMGLEEILQKGYSPAELANGDHHLEYFNREVGEAALFQHQMSTSDADIEDCKVRGKAFFYKGRPCVQIFGNKMYNGTFLLADMKQTRDGAIIWIIKRPPIK